MNKLVLFFFSLFLVQMSNAQNLESQVMQIQNDHDLLGGCVLVFCPDDVVQSIPFGTANLSSNIEFTANTPIRIASISKLVTALAVIHLSENSGSFILDADISNYLGFQVVNPSFPNTPITARMLLSHQSSIIDGSQYSPFLSSTFANATVPSISELITEDGSFYSSDIFNSIEPGTYFNYSNLNYGILGTIVEGVSGLRFDEYCKTYLFEPMNLNASFSVNDLDDLNELAVIYRKFNGVWESQVDDYGGISPGQGNLTNYAIGSNALRFSPQGGLRISANDLAQIMQLFLNEGYHNGVEIISSGSIASMIDNEWTFNGSNGNNYFGLFQSWGLGVHRSNTSTSDMIFGGNNLLFGHPGEAYGLVSDAYVSFDLNGGFIFFTNGCGAGYTVPSNSAYYTVELDVFQAIDENDSFGQCAPVNIDENMSGEEIHIFPNPAGEHIEILLEDLQGELLEISIYDVSGKKVLEIEHRGENNPIVQLEGMKAGNYVVYINSPGTGQKWSVQLIKE
jgi:CubicO group peptidase (beta-lactamase class C family)